MQNTDTSSAVQEIPNSDVAVVKHSTAEASSEEVSNVAESNLETPVAEKSALQTTLDHMNESDSGDGKSPVLLRGTAKGLEIVIDSDATPSVIGSALGDKLEKSPDFFAGNDAIVRFEGKLPPGVLSRLEEVTGRYSLHIVEVSSLRPEKRKTVDTVEPLAEQAGSPIVEAAVSESAAVTNAIAELPSSVAQVAVPEGSAPNPVVSQPLEMVDEAVNTGPQLVMGPVRSGSVLEREGHLLIIGDVNPGAEVRATGNIIVLGRLKGIAHAAVGRDAGFILALTLEPQQLRIGKMVARSDGDVPARGPEIAYVNGKHIVVEPFVGKLASGLAATM